MKLPDLAKRAAPLFGYLVTTFQADKPGVFQHLSIGDDPYNFRPLNNGQPIFKSTVGSLQIRDPYLLVSPSRDDFWILGTDLDVGKTSWREAEKHGNHSVVVSHSKNMVNWSETYLLPVEDKEAGFVWAPSAIWSDEKKAFLLVWSSNRYASNDPHHKKEPQKSVFRYVTTADFKTFSMPSEFGRMNHRSVLDQEFLRLSNGDVIHFGTDATGDAKWHQKSTWAALYTRLIDGKSESGGNANESLLDVKGGLGTAAFQNNADPTKLHVWIDYHTHKHPHHGYEGYEATFDGKNAKAIRFHPANKPISPAGMRHGSVTPLTKDEYNRLDKDYDKVKAAGVTQVKDTGNTKPKGDANPKNHIKGVGRDKPKSGVKGDKH